MAKTKDCTQEFLNEFKRVEQIIQQVYGAEKTFYDLEQIMNEQGNAETAKQMQVCRLIRNYASHNPNSHNFMPVPEELVAYLQKLYIEISSELQKVKDAMSRTKAMLKSDDVAYGAQRLAKLPAVPVVDSDGMLLGAFDFETLRKCVAEGVTPKTKLSKETVKLSSVQAISCVTQHMAMCDVLKLFKDEGLPIIYVTDTGKPKGKYIGTVVNIFE